MGNDDGELSSRLLSTTDCRVWAEEFMKINQGKLEKIDEDLMLTWFANAMMCMYDYVLKEQRQKTVWPKCGVDGDVCLAALKAVEK